MMRRHASSITVATASAVTDVGRRKTERAPMDSMPNSESSIHRPDSLPSSVMGRTPTLASTLASIVCVSAADSSLVGSTTSVCSVRRVLVIDVSLRPRRAWRFAHLPGTQHAMSVEEEQLRRTTCMRSMAVTSAHVHARSLSLLIRTRRFHRARGATRDAHECARRAPSISTASITAPCCRARIGPWACPCLHHRTIREPLHLAGRVRSEAQAHNGALNTARDHLAHWQAIHIHLSGSWSPCWSLPLPCCSSQRRLLQTLRHRCVASVERTTRRASTHCARRRRWTHRGREGDGRRCLC